MNIKWDSKGYTDNFDFVHKYGEDVLKLIDAEIGSLVVDLGCGNGALSQKLQDRGYRVKGIDASQDMLKVAAQLHPEIEFQLGDATEFSLEEKADVIFSNAVLHWIDGDQQDRLVKNMAEQLKPGGQLVCEFGGKGCAETVHAALERNFEKRGLHYPRTFYFPTIGEYGALLEKHGLLVKYAVLFDRPTEQKGENGLESWIKMFVKKPFEGMETALQEEIIRETVEELRDVLCRDGRWIVDYVRIRIKAVKKPECCYKMSYSRMLQQAGALIEGVSCRMTNLANISALLNMKLKNINWVGFYLVEGQKLILGPFQGKPACTRIDMGKGVCGMAAAGGETILVKNVHEFPGHIACDSASMSEMVIPICPGGKVVGVLDIDSPVEGRFTEEDRKGLEEIVKLVEKMWEETEG